MLSNFCHMMFVPMLFSAVPDTVDYGLHRTGKGAMAMFCGGHLFVLKLGNALGGFFVGHMLAWFGYQPNVEQTDRALKGIMAAYAGSSIVAAAAGAGMPAFLPADARLAGPPGRCA